MEQPTAPNAFAAPQGTDRVLVVDPDAAVRAKVRGILEEDGYRVFECDDCFAALPVIRAETIDLVLVNIEQACDSGIDAIEAIRKEYPTLPLVVTSHAV